MVRYPPWYLVLHRHICAIPHFATYRAIVVRYPIKTSTKMFCDTIATRIARYEKYRCWASKYRNRRRKKACEGPNSLFWGAGAKPTPKKKALGIWLKFLFPTYSGSRSDLGHECNSKSCSENTWNSESCSENGLFTPTVFLVFFKRP